MNTLGIPRLTFVVDAVDVVLDRLRSPSAELVGEVAQYRDIYEQTRTCLASGGIKGHESNGVHALVLATTGRRTGVARRTCLVYGTDGADFVVVASNVVPTRIRLKELDGRIVTGCPRFSPARLR